MEVIKCESCGKDLRAIQQPIELGREYVCASCNTPVSQEVLDLLSEQGKKGDASGNEA